MSSSVHFDFSNNFYTVSGLNTPTASPKEIGRGKTYETVRALFATMSAPNKNAGSLYTLSLFTKSLTAHVETHIHRRYGIFSRLILYIGARGFGTLGKLYELNSYYKEQAVATLFQEFQKADTKQKALLLGNIYTLKPDATTGIEEVDARYRQLSALQTSLKPSDSIKMAWTLAMRTGSLVNNYLKKTADGDIPRSLFYDPQESCYYIRLKTKGESLVAETDVKRITKAIRVPELSQKAEVVAELTTKNSVNSTMRKLTFGEYEIAKKVKGASSEWPPGIWPILHAVEYEKQKEGKTYKKVSLFEPLGEGKFSRFCKSATFNEVVTAVKTLVQGLHSMHKNGYVHGDIKNSNTQFKGKDVGWIDFGLSCPASREGAHSIYRAGYYGTLIYSAPEYISAKGFEGTTSDYIRMDMWALGLMLYRSWLKKDPKKWCDIIPNSSSVELDAEEKAAYKDAIREAVLTPLEALLQKENLSPKERFSIIIYKMMHPDPKKRLTTQEALRALELLAGNGF